jgi:hypothetical protein
MGPASKGVSPQGPRPSASPPQRCAFRGPPSRIPRRPPGRLTFGISVPSGGSANLSRGRKKLTRRRCNLLNSLWIPRFGGGRAPYPEVTVPKGIP